MTTVYRKDHLGRDLTSGTSVEPGYTYDGDTGLWTVSPGQSPGCARFKVAGSDYSPDTAGDGSYMTFDLEETLGNAEVATLQPDGQTLMFAASGLYLIAARGSIAMWGESVTDPEEYIHIRCAGQNGFSQSWSNIHPDTINLRQVFFTTGLPTLCLDTDGMVVSLSTVTYPWRAYFDLTIVRLN